MDDKQGSHAVARRPAAPRPVAGQNLHLRLADSRRMEGLLLKTHTSSVRLTLCGQSDVPSAVSLTYPLR